MQTASPARIWNAGLLQARNLGYRPPTRGMKGVLTIYAAAWNAGELHAQRDFCAIRKKNIAYKLCKKNLRETE